MSYLNRCSRTPKDDKHMSNLERNGKRDAIQCQKNQSHVFPPRNHPGLQCNETTTKRPGSENVSSIISHETQFDYLGLRLDLKMNMKAAVASILEKANKGHSLALAVSYSLRYDKDHSNPTFCSSPVEMLNLWKLCVLPHFLLYICCLTGSNITGHSQQVTQHHTACLWAPHSTSC